MTPDELRAIITFLRERVQLGTVKEDNTITITFTTPMEEEMIGAGLKAEGVKRILTVPWWEEMVVDIIETPDYCESDDPSQQVLEYARDVVTDYIGKRFPLNDE